MRDYTKTTVETRYSRLIGLIDDISNEIHFVSGTEEAQEAVLDMLDEARIIIRSLQTQVTELTLEAG